MIPASQKRGFNFVKGPGAKLEKNFKGISLKVRGNGQKYYVFIRTSGTMLPWQYYKSDFLSQIEWSEVNLEFKNFVRSSPWLSKTIKPE